MTQDRKYFGMTLQQLGILGGMWLLGCFLFCVVGILILRRGASSLATRPEQQVNTPVPQSLPTLAVTPTFTPTSIPTALPYDQLIPAGWTQYKTALIELWLPTGFKKTDPKAVTGISGNAVVMELALISTSKSYAYKPAISVSYEPLTTDTLEHFVDQKLSNIPTNINLAERKKVSINSVDAYRLLFEGRTSTNVNTNDLLFIFQDGGTVWYVKYSAEIADFYELLSVFEQSVKTFRIVR